jgi:hypothetical protein
MEAASPSSTKVGLLVRSKGTRNENERSLGAGKYVAWMFVGNRNSDRLVSTERGPMLGQ